MKTRYINNYRKNLYKKALSYIKQGEQGKEYFEDDIIYDPRQEYFCQLGKLYSYTFSWYPFTASDSVLVIGDIFGSCLGAIAGSGADISVLIEPDTELSESVTIGSNSVSSIDLQKAIISSRYSSRENIRFLTDPLDDSLFDSFNYIIYFIRPYPNGQGYDADQLLERTEVLSDFLADKGRVILVCQSDEIDGLTWALRDAAIIPVDTYRPIEHGPVLFEFIYDESSFDENVIGDRQRYVHSRYQEYSRRSQMEQYFERDDSMLYDATINAWINNHYFPWYGPWDAGDGYLKSDRKETIDEVKGVLLDLLRTLKKVADDHGLTLYPIYGTMLGTVREAGIIEGDDDIDVALMREDFDKLRRLASSFPEPYFLQMPENDNCFFGGYLKLRNKNTTSINPQNWHVDCCEGIGIDIFPIDKGYRDEEKELRKLWKIKQLQRILFADVYGFFPRFKDMKLLVWKGYKYFGKLFKKQTILKLFDRVLSSGDKKDSTVLGIYTHYLMNGAKPRYFDRAAFDKLTKCQFEDMEFDVPVSWDAILSRFYGNYMEPIAWAEWRQLHGFYDVHLPYGRWKERFGCERTLANLNERRIVLFGEPVLMREYLKRYTDDAHRPYKICIIPDKRTNFFRMQANQAFPIEGRKDLMAGVIKELSAKGLIECDIEDIDNPEDIYPIICAINPMSIEKKLNERGFNKCYYYWYNRDWILRANYDSIRREIVGLEQNT